jgi:DNA mismatch repair ATPase MutS
VLPAALWTIPMVIGIVLSFAMAHRTHAAFSRAGVGQQSLGQYAELFEHSTATPFGAPATRALQERLTADGAAAHRCMQQLNRILGYAELRTAAALLHFPIQALTLWDFHVAFALDRWRRRAGGRVRDWLEAIGDLDALAVLAAVRHDNPSWCVPEIGSDPRFQAVGLGHPLLRDDRRVANDVEVGPPGTLLLITGSNMSGKSTLLRAIGLNAVLAQAGSVACASRLSMPACDLETSIRVQDSLELGLSYFMAALARLKGVVDAAQSHRPGRVLLYLLDEILQGTNSAERGIAVRAVARRLLDAGAIGAMTTHDLNLAGEEPLSTAARLVHFSETVDEAGQMRFDYQLREGLATSRNALRLMRLIGIEI